MTRLIRRNILTAIAPLGLLLLNSCHEEHAPSGPARFDGVVSANVSAFTSTSDRCSYSFLFDNFRVEWPPKTQLKSGQVAAQAERSFSLAAAAGARNKTARFDIRGSWVLTGPAPTANATVSIAGRDHVIALPNGGDTNEFNQRFEMTVAKDAEFIPVVLRTSIGKPSSPDTQALLDIDSVDVVLVAPGCGLTDAAPNAIPTPAPANSS